MGAFGAWNWLQLWTWFGDERVDFPPPHPSGIAAAGAWRERFEIDALGPTRSARLSAQALLMHLNRRAAALLPALPATAHEPAKDRISREETSRMLPPPAILALRTDRPAYSTLRHWIDLYLSMYRRADRPTYAQFVYLDHPASGERLFWSGTEVPTRAGAHPRQEHRERVCVGGSRIP